VKVAELAPLRVRAVQLLALWGFAVAQPIYSLLHSQPFWFAVEGYDGIDLALYAVALLLIPVAALVAVEFVLQLVSRTVSIIVHDVFVAALSAFLIGRLLGFLPGNAVVLVAFGAGFFFARLLRMWRPLQQFVTICAAATVIFLALFLYGAPFAKLDQDNVALAGASAKSRPPVVLVIFDEFAESSLLAPNGEVDSVRYPHFAALERAATWYRNATTVNDYTFWAVPSILTGRRARTAQLPMLADHPKNLFTLLAAAGYRVHAFQPVTRMCPESACGPTPHRSLGRRLFDAGSHLRGSLRRFLFLTREYELHVPDWNDPPGQVHRFLRVIGSQQTRELYVLHVLLPHGPWRYLPSGRQHVFTPVHDVKGSWTSNAAEVDGAYRDHLLQVGYVDDVLGQIMQRLRARRIWDRSLVVVTADHGVSFRPGDHRRSIDATNFADIAFVPLFVKLPGQRVGRIDRETARTTDIVPTIADAIGLQSGWSFDGRSLLARRPSGSSVLVDSLTHGPERASWAAVRREREATVEQKAALFGSGNDPRLIAGIPVAEPHASATK
jgi:arylsulfatase A-like enzyme